MGVKLGVSGLESSVNEGAEESICTREGMEQEGEKDSIMKSYVIGTSRETEAKSYYGIVCENPNLCLGWR